MRDSDFYVQLVEGKGVLGAGLKDSPEVWESRLGDEYIDDFRKAYGRRDYGLIELSLQKVDRAWECFGISVQVHRLATGAEGMVPAPLGNEFGSFRPRLPFACLTDGLAGSELILSARGPSADGSFEVFEAQGSGHRVQVLVAKHNVGGVDAGDVWSIAVGSLV